MLGKILTLKFSLELSYYMFEIYLNCNVNCSSLSHSYPAICLITTKGDQFSLSHFFGENVFSLYSCLNGRLINIREILCLIQMVWKNLEKLNNFPFYCSLWFLFPFATWTKNSKTKTFLFFAISSIKSKSASFLIKWASSNNTWISHNKDYPFS